MDTAIQDKIREWTSPPYDEQTRREIQALVDANNEKELTDRFYRDLEFGTGGLRGVQGAGSNRMNIYNVQKVTQGLANYIIAKKGQKKGIVIGRDSRINSDVYAQTVASVMVANGIKVYYYQDIHPTPTTSFAIRHLGAMAGVMVTASHNPQQYNGYKVFWDDGAQVTSPVDQEIIDEVNKITSLEQVENIEFKKAEKNALFRYIDEKIDPLFLDMTRKLSIHPEVIPSSGVKICYSPLHGVGYKLVPEALKKYGFKDVISVKEQAIPDGTFPTAPFPNPELPEAMQLGIRYSKEQNADVFIATDPDADRIGAALRQDNGDYLLLNGNQIGALLVHYVLSELQATGKMPAQPHLISTIVTTSMLMDMCKANNVTGHEVLTGFKWIALRTREIESQGGTFVFGCEESHGYNASPDVRDKDAVNAACLFAELTAFYKSQGQSVAHVLDSLYEKYGYYKESQTSIYMEGKEGADKIQKIMTTLREHTPKKIGRYDMLVKKDVKNGEIRDVQTGEKIGKLDLPSSNVIVMELTGRARVIARPSGTEPKIKFYFTTWGKPQGNIAEIKTKVDSDHEYLQKEFFDLMGIRK